MKEIEIRNRDSTREKIQKPTKIKEKEKKNENENWN